MSKKWKYGNVSCDYYHNEAGKILGKITKISFSDEIYSAEANGNDLGEYIDKAHAKAAVEKAINSPYFDLDDIISRNTFEEDTPTLDTGMFDLKFDYTLSTDDGYSYPPQEPSPLYETTTTYTIEATEEKPKKKKKK